MAPPNPISNPKGLKKLLKNLIEKIYNCHQREGQKMPRFKAKFKFVAIAGLLLISLLILSQIPQ